MKIVPEDKELRDVLAELARVDEDIIWFSQNIFFYYSLTLNRQSYYYFSI